MDVKMIKATYLPETEELKISIYPDGEDGVGASYTASETVDFRDFMNSIPTDRTRIEYLLSKIKDIRENRLTKIDEFIATIQQIMLKQVEIRDSMEEAVERQDHKGVKSLSLVHKALLDEKNTLREIRYAIKLLDNDEGKLMVAVLELSA